MSRVKKAIFILTSSFYFYSCGGPIEESSDVFSVSLESVQWLVGEWQDRERPNQWEIWKEDEEGLSGLAIHIRSTGDTTVFEKMRINEEDGNLVFTAVVRENKGPVQFKSRRIDKNLIVFENPEHDFPKYIAYTLLDIEDALVDVLETEAGDGEKGVRTQLLRRK